MSKTADVDLPATSEAADAPPPTPAAPRTPKLGEDEPPPQLGDDADADIEDASEGEGEGVAADAAGEDENADAPIEYDFGEPPDGAAPYRPAVLEAFRAEAGKIRLPADQAKQLLDGMRPALEADFEQQVGEHIETESQRMRAELEQRHGDKIPELIRLGNRALATFAPPALRQAIAKSPMLANNPDFIEMLANVGRRISNDRPPPRGTSHRARPLSAEDAAAAQYLQNERR